ncbi:hypothetical protein ALC56_03156 [Trachymyrmex septentrionalis]|uniref:Uncharacterized protein n=1 Tax=Trachymyrmex septentrionalis TaxID=34720 RepID=A0A151JZG0_9HYME|nr:hypothetical protein ALC56_03156 [Trachymyrmex septentrionalis]
MLQSGSDDGGGEESGSWALYVIQPSIHRRVPKDLRFFLHKQNIGGYGTALTLRDTQRVLVFYAVHRESDWCEAINRNVLAGKCKLSAKPRFETMLLVMDGVGGVGRRPKSGPERAILATS